VNNAGPLADPQVPPNRRDLLLPHSAMSRPASDSPPIELRDPLWRSFVSLVLLVHLLCIAFVYSANVNPSRLQVRLAGVLAPYTQLLHLDPGGARLQFTDGSERSDDHVVTVARKLSDGSASQADAVRLPADEPRLSGERRRLLTIAGEMADYVERDDLIAHFAKAIGASVMRQKEWDHVIVTVAHQGAQPLDDDVVPEDRSTDYVVYEAEVWTDEDGELQVQKLQTGLNVAPTAQGGLP